MVSVTSENLKSIHIFREGSLFFMYGIENSKSIHIFREDSLF